MNKLKMIEENVNAHMRFYSDSLNQNNVIVEWEDAYGGRPQRCISISDYNTYKNGIKSAYEIIVKAQTGNWPPTKKEKLLAEKQFISETPTALISNPKSQLLFTQEELAHLIPIAEQKWIDWKGTLPENYVSPLK